MSGGLEELGKKYRDKAVNFDAFLRGFLTEMGLRALAKTKRRTPVDTGLLRASWALSAVVRRENNLDITLFNPVEYATYVEYGRKRFPWSSGERLSAAAGDSLEEMDWVPGRLMATISLHEVRAEMPRRYQKAFAEWVKEQKEG